jgi:hypothetical protein
MQIAVLWQRASSVWLGFVHSLVPRRRHYSRRPGSEWPVPGLLDLLLSRPVSAATFPTYRLGLNLAKDPIS